MASKVKDALSRSKAKASAKIKRSKPTVSAAETPKDLSSDASSTEEYDTPPSSLYQGSESTPSPSKSETSEQPHPRLVPRQRRRDASADDDPNALTSKYKLRVTAGPSYDRSTHRLVNVNGADCLSFENEFVRVKVKTRIRDYTGLPLTSPATTPYFDDPAHSRDRYSISFSFVPKADLPSADCVWGPDFDHPVRDRLPPGFNYAFGIVKRFIDPGIECDAYADEPWLYGPALSCWFVLRVGDKVGQQGDVPDIHESPALAEGGDGDGEQVRKGLSLPTDADKRRKWFLDREHREAFVFEEGRAYQGDFFNPYLDFNKFALRLPGFSLGVLRYIDDKTHTLRWVFKNRTTGDVYFVVVFNLLFGQELEEALRAEDEEYYNSAEQGE
ncbi:hypothetical protein IWZ03DRAFT_310116 [Phyllosticta citriasiana]|uniref:Domain of unknown function at the cortex 1 domain-containing protein n=1 Tax=Phyllosticta citriasiana TaxID=595635 RepID=A0ABR1KM63_9PEZI